MTVVKAYFVLRKIKQFQTAVIEDLVIRHKCSSVTSYKATVVKLYFFLRKIKQLQTVAIEDLVIRHKCFSYKLQGHRLFNELITSPLISDRSSFPRIRSVERLYLTHTTGIGPRLRASHK